MGDIFRAWFIDPPHHGTEVLQLLGVAIAIGWVFLINRRRREQEQRMVAEFEAERNRFRAFVALGQAVAKGLGIDSPGEVQVVQNGKGVGVVVHCSHLGCDQLCELTQQPDGRIVCRIQSRAQEGA